LKKTDTGSLELSFSNRYTHEGSTIFIDTHL